MTRIGSSLLAAVSAAALTLGGLYLNQRSRVGEAAHLRAENGRLRLEVSQRHQARISPPATQPTSHVPAEPARPSDDAQTARPLESDYRNEGQSSPLATLQTFAWACDRGDSETIQSLLCFEAAGRAKAETLLASLPPEARAKWNSPEAMAAELLTHHGMQQPFPVANVLERAVPESMPDGRITLRLPGTPKDGTVYQKIGDRWHYVITEAAVDHYIATRSPSEAR